MPEAVRGSGGEWMIRHIDRSTRWFRHNHPYVLLISTTLLILILPVGRDDIWVELLVGTLLVLATASALPSISRNAVQFTVNLGLILIWLALRIHRIYAGDWTLAPQLAFLGITLLIFWRLVTNVLRAREVDSATLASALTGYLMIGVVWAQLYLLSVYAFSDAFSPKISVSQPSTLLYFSFATMTTIGYGDLAPVHPFVRNLAVLEAIAGVFYNAVVIARLVALYTGPAPKGGGSQASRR